MAFLDILIPVSTGVWNESVKSAAEKIIKKEEINIRVTSLDKGPISIESEYDEVLASPEVIKKAELLEKDQSDGIIIYCFGEPGLEACKEKLSIPVVGLRESAVSMAKLLGQNIGVISTIPSAIPRHYRDLKNDVRKIIPLNISVTDLTNYSDVEISLRERAKELLNCGCDVIVLGCGSILNIELGKLQDEIGIPIIVPLYSSLFICEYFLQCNLKQSKVAYPFPPNKPVR
ncbi:MAG: AroM family protein [Acetomicrobium sp.]|jgi:allantoin racemase